MVDEPSSVDLLRASRSGDRIALRQLLLRHLPALRAFVRLRMSALLRARESAEDLVQSARCELLQAIDDVDYRGEDAFRGWLFTAVWHKLQDKEQAVRAQKRDARRELPLDPGEPPMTLGAVYGQTLSPSGAAMADEEVRRLEAAFETLPAQHREVIALARIARLPRAEVAARMGRSEGSVRNLLTRALIDLAKQLDQPSRSDR